MTPSSGSEPGPVLVDTSVWIDHLRSTNAELVPALERGQAWCHPLIVGELACGNLAKRREILTLLEALPTAEVAEHDEVLAFLETHDLPGCGMGWIDTHLLASARLTRLPLWTLDERLAAIARQLGLAP